ncbi:hypothetical protein B9Q03_11595 [Candidatus Marsarchaeota G2 archaeon OSP_D]|jgi:uncharacterized membrane protein|uniref:Vitamin K epoxide reductase domain-containing protein n=5 Tax=Candidatus Marsarchaeota group 2 TaxID=2203771 RepID=A0A2R6CC92_9ARCH|nr:MAG: hypothetical protein B9Q03_11595 [Candidatus Marsarchaeota G2 archaeon OSP_D]PSN96580.1 MAG: hypothetical protein B9Q06_00020 [Candidatus Marsarchaeota G2 archaeon ECH_B_2]PSN98174.1 MAG: hypothetical protein B9Q07_10500 [Candidatus Marsarchaeota G2 archaeon ECH_B_3]PSO03281.1 MAG: hypothetical protein B9Q05_00020 [Candidatus Marsarchaeota G2 archaeon ECH_B_1]PSO08525.1 MAG: hypothetical protein B9Q04_05110 [Candidatus Marsarchaeota G2 archaeon BE_D]
MNRLQLLALGLSLLGLGVSAYLTAQSFNSHIPLSCPSTGIINCAKVTTSTYSHILGVPVALLGAIWFIVIIALVLLDLNWALLPFWTLGLVFVAYLVFTEVFLIHSICVYCTAVHITVLVLGYPVGKLSLSGE